MELSITRKYKSFLRDHLFISSFILGNPIILSIHTLKHIHTYIDILNMQVSLLAPFSMSFIYIGTLNFNISFLEIVHPFTWKVSQS